MQSIKRRFFAMRNGVVADTLRRAGSPFHVIFGLNLPQIVEIAREVDSSAAPELGRALWANRTTRESMLAAPILMDAAATDRARAEEMLREAPCAEVTDVLCHRLLRHLPFAAQMAEALSDDSDEGVRYGALRLMFNLVAAHPEQALAMGQAELKRGCAYTRQIAAALADEAEFMLTEARTPEL